MIGAENIAAYIYIYHLGVEFNLPILPDTITDSMNINFSQQDVLARSAPQMTFTQAGPRTLQVSLPIHRQLFALENPQVDALTKKKVVTLPDPVTGQKRVVNANDAADLLINALLALSLPKYMDATKAIIPPSLLIRYGNESSIRGVPSQVVKTTSGPWLKSGKQAVATISFTVTETQPFSAQYVAKNGSLRGLSTDLTRSSVWQW